MKALLVCSIGSLKSAAIAVGTFYAAKKLGIEIVGMSGASGGSLPLPILAQKVDMEKCIELFEAVDERKVNSSAVWQWLIDEGRDLVGLPDRVGKRPLTGYLKGKGMRQELQKMYSKVNALTFEKAKIPFVVSASLVAPERGYYSKTICKKDSCAKIISLKNDKEAKELINNPGIALVRALQSDMEVVFDSGDVVSPIRASTAIPLVFEPEYINGQGLFVDSAVLDALPIKPAIEKFGVENIIMADATTDLFEQEYYSADVNSCIDVMISVLYATIRDSTLEDIRDMYKLLEANNKKAIRVNPKVSIGMFDTDKFGEAVYKTYDQALSILSNEVGNESRFGR